MLKLVHSSRFYRAATITVVVATSMLAFSACGQNAHSGGTDQNSAAGAISHFPVSSRSLAPNISGSTLDGKQFDLNSLRGKVVVLNVWGSWCPPCRAEMPTLEQVYQQEQAKGVQFVGIDTRDVASDALSFARGASITYPSISDPDGNVVLQFSGIIPPAATPCTLVIDRKGRIAARAITPVTQSDLDSMIDPVLGESA